MIKKRLLTLLGLICLAISGMAQSDDSNIKAQDTYNKAVTEYDKGLFDRSETALQEVISSGSGLLKTSAYRLLTLCKLEQGDFAAARRTVTELLRYDPYFTPSLGDPQRFIDIINDIKSQEAGITTASRQAESINEAPVPVTLITQEMIRHSGAQTLQQLLCLYVPGMTLAEGIESNIAMHGIYSMAQDKILFMLDGHRLNSSSTNAEAPDFRNSLDKIQQIEVLRGPASSLYGNVALTAVVNIITRKGAAMNGGRLTGIIGTQNTYGGSLVVGGGNNVLDLLGWGAITNTKGFAHTVDNGNGGTATLYSNGYRGRPTYDIGIKGRWKDFSFTLNMQRSKRVPYVNALQVPNDMTVEKLLECISTNTPNLNSYKNYDYDKYEAIGGDKPGLTRSSNRLNFDYRHSLGSLDIEATAYLSMERTSLYNVLGDNIDKHIGESMMVLLGANGQIADPSSASYKFSQILKDMPVQTIGVYQKLDMQNTTYGLQAQARCDYRFLGTGSAVFGLQYEMFDLTNATFNMGGNYTANGLLSSDLPYESGNEHTMSGFLQLKHYFLPHLIFSGGMRYDHKERFNKKKINRLSPRASLIVQLPNGYSLRGAYNFSFVDAPYFYRASLISLFSGGPDMKSETMHSFNIDVTYHKASSPFMAEAGIFCNILNDLVVPNPALNVNYAKVETYMFNNAGRVRIIGAEGSTQYTRPRFFLNINATWQRIISSESYLNYGDQTYGTPALHGNITTAWSPLRNLWLRGSANIQSATHHQSNDLLSTYASGKYLSAFTRVAPQCTLNIGAGYEMKHLEIDLSLSNITNNQYKIGATLIDGIPHAGRQFITKLTMKF